MNTLMTVRHGDDFELIVRGKYADVESMDLFALDDIMEMLWHATKVVQQRIDARMRETDPER